MKQLLLLFVAIVTGSLAFAQSNVYLKLNHQLNGSAFQLNTAATNNTGAQFDVVRMQYYLGEITLIHDGGLETTVPSTWFLVDGSIAFNELLGSYAINTLESIRFGVGVDTTVNHLDPSTYASGHPLAPQQPSMHWGWQSGYRFAAMEGNGGQNLNQYYEIHALGDGNYYKVTIPTAGFSNGSDLTIELDADYAKALTDINVSDGLTTHGTDREAAILLQNFRDHVFTASGAHTSVAGELEGGQINMQIAPNPVGNDQAFRVIADFPKHSTIKITDLSGRVVLENKPVGGVAEMEISVAGFYLVSILKDGAVIGNSKLVVNR